MPIKNIMSFILCALLCLNLSVHVFADEISLINSSTNKRQVNLFLTGDINSSNISCKISNVDAKVISNGQIGSMNTVVKTTLLIDISNSVNGEIAEEAVKYLHHIVENLTLNEQIKIMTFGKEISTICDFTSDRYDLDKTINSLQFNNSESRIYDAIYNTIPDESITNENCLARTLVITDGVDETNTGITKEELYLKLQNAKYPIDIICLGESENKDLLALARISGGRSSQLYSGSIYSEIDAAIRTDNIFNICVEVPQGLCDGSVRQFDLTIGTVKSSFDIKLPAIDTPQINSQNQPEKTPDITESSQSTTKSSEENTTNNESQPSPNPSSKKSIIIFASIGIAVLITVIIVITITNKNKSKNSKNKVNVPNEYNSQNYNKSFNSGDMTVLLSDNSQSQSNNSSSSFEEAITIILTNAQNSAQKWTFELKRNTVIKVGRDKTCDVVLTDTSVSHMQFKLYSNNGETILENMSQSNITQVNYKTITSPTKLSNNDEIKCGRVVLIFNSNNGQTSMLY